MFSYAYSHLSVISKTTKLIYIYIFSTTITWCQKYVLQFFIIFYNCSVMDLYIQVHVFSTTIELIIRQYKCLDLMYGNRRPKLLEVIQTYSQFIGKHHNRCLYSYRYRTHIPPWYYHRDR